eukprot:CAMPEP_0170587074 /NCGR_PEP_ID=MMETSP0224-20130122/10089_1 /TAXON_ID=285029 /ORGANISM="Togula jolla, Strain CCCM 725" /LENGTH=202 /DNA_ID=CAMNT_0010910673 /DNA_START=36 /DNA_END=644 /DNA_ORIENTATION=-
MEDDNKNRLVTLLKCLTSLLAIAVWSFVAAIAMDNDEQGFGFNVMWETGLTVPFILGVLITLQGWGKLASPLPYFRDVGAFQVPLPSWLIGVSFMAVEFYSGPVLLMGSLAGEYGAIFSCAAVGALLDIAAYVTLSLYGFFGGLAYSWKLRCEREDGLCVKNCTCFGQYGAQKLSVWVLVQDVLVVLETVFVAARIISRGKI